MGFFSLADAKTAAHNFMRRQGRLSENFDHSATLSRLVEECSRSMELPTSIPMLNSHLLAEFDAVPQEDLLIMDAGGTNFRVVVLNLRDWLGRLKAQQDTTPLPFKYFKNYAMPGAKGRVSGAQFFEAVSEFLRPVVQQHQEIKFCFSYPTEIDSEGEGRLVSCTKEIDAPELVGLPLRAGLVQCLREKGLSSRTGAPWKMVIVNDTLSTLLLGKLVMRQQNKEKNFFTYLGLVFGTGFNLAYQENFAFKQPLLINSEIGNYAHLPPTPLDTLIDTSSNLPGRGRTEKAVGSGPYFEKIILQVLKSAAQEQLFSVAAGKVIAQQTALVCEGWHENLTLLLKSELPSKEVYQKFFSAALPSTEAERALLAALMQLVVQRSAYLAALVTTGLTLHALRQAPPQKTPYRVCVSLDGSMIEKVWGLRAAYEAQLKAFLAPHQIIPTCLLQPHAPLLGTALASYHLNPS